MAPMRYTTRPIILRDVGGTTTQSPCVWGRCDHAGCAMRSGKNLRALGLATLFAALAGCTVSVQPWTKPHSPTPPPDAAAAAAAALKPPPGGPMPGYPPNGYTTGGLAPIGYPSAAYPPAGYPSAGYPPA